MLRQLLTCLIAVGVLSTSHATKVKDKAETMAKLGPHLGLLNELSPRRRTSRFFVNEQSPLLGVQEGFVNVGRGNLTFVNRDLVTVGRIPIVAGRVFDSANTHAGDFGPGWRLTLSESLQSLASGDWLYTDESGSVETLTPSGGAFTPAVPGLSDTRTLTLDGDLARITHRTGSLGNGLLYSDTPIRPA